jgi:hypothetical protein
MANNRMYLKCRGCDKTFLLGKVLGSNYYVNYGMDNKMQRELNDFYDEHGFCSEKKEVHNENQFELEYEFKRDDEEIEVTLAPPKMEEYIPNTPIDEELVETKIFKMPTHIGCVELARIEALDFLERSNVKVKEVVRDRIVCEVGSLYDTYELHFKD